MSFGCGRGLSRALGTTLISRNSVKEETTSTTRTISRHREERWILSGILPCLVHASANSYILLDERSFPYRQPISQNGGRFNYREAGYCKAHGNEANATDPR